MSVVAIDFQDGVNDFDVGVNESIFLSFVVQKRVRTLYVTLFEARFSLHSFFSRLKKYFVSFSPCFVHLTLDLKIVSLRFDGKGTVQPCPTNDA